MFTIREHKNKLNISIDKESFQTYVHYCYLFTDRERSKTVNTWAI